MRLTRAGWWLVAFVGCSAFYSGCAWLYLVAGPWLRGER